MNLFDSHFHFDPEASPADYFTPAVEAGVSYGIAVGGHLEESKRSRLLANTAENIWFSVGVHPHEADVFDGDLAPFAELAEDPKMVAVGEVGLDFFYDNSDRENQLKTLDAFISFAARIKKPLILHCRDKEDVFESYELLYERMVEFAKTGLNFELHCYTGSIEWMEKFLELGSSFGVTGIVTFPKAQNVRDIVKKVPLDRLLLETDSPYLAPAPNRGKKNHPRYLRSVAEMVAKTRLTTVEEIAQITVDNTFSFFNIKR